MVDPCPARSYLGHSVVAAVIMPHPLLIPTTGR